MKKLLFFIVISVTVTGLVYSQGWNIEMLDTKYTNWQEAEFIAQQGNYAYLGFDYSATSGGGFAILDISDVTNPFEVGYFVASDDYGDIQVAGDYAYLGYWGDGLSVLNVSNPYNPVQVSGMSNPANIYDIFLDGDIAYISSNDGGFTVADISDPFNTRYLYEHSFGDGGKAVFALDNIVYLSGDDLLRIIDVSDPSDPRLVNSLVMPRDPADFYYDGEYLYIALRFDGFHIYDISDPVNPVLVGTSSMDAYDIIVENDVAYMRSMGNVLTTMDVSHPQTPTVLGSIQTSGSLKNIVKFGDYILAAYDNYGFKAILVSDPVNPQGIPNYEPNWDINGVALNGDYAYITDDEVGLMVLDISDPADLIQAAILNTIGSAQSIDIANDYAFISNYQVGHYVVAINEPLDPRVEGEVDLEGFICFIDESTDRIYVSGNQRDLKIYDMSSATNPQLLGTYNLMVGGYDMAWFNDIDVEGDFLYGIAYYYEPGDGGPLGDSLLVLDITDPTNPNFVSMTNLGGGSFQIEVRNNLAYIGANQPMLRIADVSDPIHPILVGGIDYPGSTDGLILEYDYVYIRSGFDVSIRVIDISNPEAPEQTGYYTTPDNPKGFAVRDEKIYVADGDHFESYDCDDAVWVTPQEATDIPAGFILHNPYPNPFNQRVALDYMLPSAGDIRLVVYDITGREVRVLQATPLQAGYHEVVWDASGQASGVYFVRLEAGDFMQTRKILLVK